MWGVFASCAQYAVVRLERALSQTLNNWKHPRFKCSCELTLSSSMLSLWRCCGIRICMGADWPMTSLHPCSLQVSWSTIKSHHWLAICFAVSHTIFPTIQNLKSTPQSGKAHTNTHFLLHHSLQSCRSVPGPLGYHIELLMTWWQLH